MAGVDAVTSLLALSITLFNGCMKGFAILCRARDCDRHIASVRLMLELEQHKFFTWAEEIGLLEHPPQLRVVASDVNYVNAVLGELRGLLADVHKLRLKYGLRIETTPDEIEDVNDNSALCVLKVQSPVEVRGWQEATARIFRTRTQPWRRLKWVVVDEQHFRKLLADIGYFTNELYRFLEQGRRNHVERRYNTLLRSAIISTTSQLALDVISRDQYVVSTSSAIAATARVKRKWMRLDLFDRLTHSSHNNKDTRTNIPNTPLPPSRELSYLSMSSTLETESRRLSSRQLILDHIPRPSESRQLAYYDGRPAILEWRPILPSTWAELSNRVERLSNLLSVLDDPSFHSLLCRGYVINQEAGRYGFVFHVPSPDAGAVSSPLTLNDQEADVRSPPSMETLRGLLEKQRPIPPLNLRINYAIVLLETVLQLHTAGWLHKELRSDNIISIDSEARRSAQPEHAAASLYVAGYIYARADDPQDFTEPSQQALEAQLYRHPSSLGANRSSYCKSFDLFSVGCILLEIGLWSCLSNVLVWSGNADLGRSQINAENHSLKVQANRMQSVRAKHTSRAVHHSDDSPDLMFLRRTMLEGIRDSSTSSEGIFKQLEAQAGKHFADITIDCLQAFTHARLAVTEPDMTEDRYVLGLEEKWLRTLKQLVEK